MKANLLTAPGALRKVSETLSLHEERHERSPFMLPARDAAALFARHKRWLCGVLCLRCVSNAASCCLSADCGKCDCGKICFADAHYATVRMSRSFCLGRENTVEALPVHGSTGLSPDGFPNIKRRGAPGEIRRWAAEHREISF